MAKVTFTLDDETVRKIRKMAERTKKAQSLVVREAVAHYAAREDKLTPEEQERMRRVLQEMRRMLPTRPQEEVEKELREIRRSRRTGWHRPWDR
ncbi:MAG: ribbon-helix-helix protein, CopG family [Acidobacteria bacterium]|nr:ribbon-helix-helix protein, CopG family [Acidobacteriota bacterium]